MWLQNKGKVASVMLLLCIIYFLF